MEEKHLGLKFSLLNGFYWSYFATIVSFQTVFFLSYKVNPINIGIIASIGNILSSFIQPSVARIADKSKRISLKELSIVVLLISVLPIIGILLFNPSKEIAIILFIISSMFLWTLHPLVNSFGVYYINLGQKLNFGLSRSWGSALFAITVTLLGRLIDSYGIKAMLISAIILSLVVLIIILNFDIKTKGEIGLDNAGIIADEDDNIFDFIKRYKSFVFVLFGVFFIYSYHNLQNTYFPQIIENIGGNFKTLGLCMGISAFSEIPLMILSERIIERFGAKKLLFYSILGFIIKSLGIALATSVPIMIIVMFTQAISYGPFVPGCVMYTNEAMDSKDMYLGQALMTGFSTIGGVLGNILGGIIIASFGVVYLKHLAIIFVLIAVIITYIGMNMDD